MKYAFLIFSLLVIAFSARAQQEIYDDLEVNGKITSISTTTGSHPCPTMTDAQMLAIASPQDGDCVYNSTLVTWLRYNSSDITWDEISTTNVSSASGVLPLANGGTNKNISASAGGIAYADADSFELTSVGTSGQFLKSNGTSAPTFSAVDISTSSVAGVLPMVNGGTDKNLTPVLGGIVYTDAGSMEVLAAGTSGYFLKSNGAAAPTWVNPGAVTCSAKVSSTGVLSNQIGGCFSSCTNVTTPVCTFTSSYWASGEVPNCWAADDASGGYPADSSTTTTTFQNVIRRHDNVALAVDRKYFCHGNR